MSVGRRIIAEPIVDLRQLSRSYIPEMVLKIPGTDKPAELRHIYNARITYFDYSGNRLYTETDIPLHEYWNNSILTLPPNRNYLAIYSRQAVRYGYIVAYMKYPDWTGWGYDNWVNFWVGFELGGGERWGIAAWMLAKTGGVNRLYAHVGGGGVLAFAGEQTISLPSDYTTNKHGYWVKVNRSQVWFGIDNRIRVFALLANSQVGYQLANNTKPYTIYIAPFTVPTTQHVLMELGDTKKGGRLVGASIELGYGDVRWSEGDPQPPLALPLYVANTDTLMAGQSISSGSITSHPIPVFGYGRSTIYFMSNQAGTLAVQIYTLSGNWRTYDSVSVSANSLVKYTITDGALAAIVVFTPSSYPAKILEAMAVMQ